MNLDAANLLREFLIWYGKYENVIFFISCLFIQMFFTFHD